VTERRVSGLVPYASETTEPGAIVLPCSAASHGRVLSDAKGLRADDTGALRIGDAPVVFSSASAAAIEAANAKRARRSVRGW
jgi:hypothetical protein